MSKKDPPKKVLFFDEESAEDNDEDDDEEEDDNEDFFESLVLSSSQHPNKKPRMEKTTPPLLTTTTLPTKKPLFGSTTTNTVTLQKPSLFDDIEQENNDMDEDEEEEDDDELGIFLMADKYKPPLSSIIKKENDTESSLEPLDIDPETGMYQELADLLRLKETAKMEEEDTIPTTDGAVERPHFPGAKPSREKAPFVLSPPEVEPAVEIPASMAQYLRPYQIEGVQFFYRLYCQNEGGLLGDDMGLGKTIQVIAMIAAILGKTGTVQDATVAKDRARYHRTHPDAARLFPTILIVVPSSVLYNWKKELETWGYFLVGMYWGAKKDEVLKYAEQGRYEVLLTTHDTFRAGAKALMFIPFSCMFVDEVHKLKNPMGQTTQTFKKFNVRRRYGLTGTAIQNTYEELWCLLDWCNPGKIMTYTEWKEHVSDPIRQGQAFGATAEQVDRRNKVLASLQRLLKRFFLRRTKKIIKHQLPKKEDRILFCELTDRQRLVYDRLIESENFQLLKRKDEKCDCGKEERRGGCCYAVNSKGESWKQIMFPCLVVLRKVCNHLCLLYPSPGAPPEKRDKDIYWLSIAFPDDWQTKRHQLTEYADPENCGKWRLLQSLLLYWQQSKTKVLLFSVSVKLITILQRLVMTLGYQYLRLDGSTPTDQRQVLVDQFNSDPDIFLFLISTRAGGIGLNLTSAQIVIVFDPDWNPAYDLQAQDRAYRIGQTKDVSVYRLIASGTMEEIIYARQIYKQQAANIAYTGSHERRYFEGVQGSRTQKGELFGLENLFAFEDQGYTRTKEIMKRNLSAEYKLQLLSVEYDADKVKEDDNSGVDGDEDGDEDAADDDDMDDETDGGEEEEGEAVDANAVGTGDGDDEEAVGLKAMAKKLMLGKSKGKEKQKGKQKRARQGTKGANAADFNTIASLLDGMGITYSLTNEEIIGSSKVEEEISLLASDAVKRHKGKEKAWDIVPAMTANASSSTNANGSGAALNGNGTMSIAEFQRRVNAGDIIVGHTPREVQLSTIEKLAQFQGFENVEEFAQYVVQNLSKEDRTKMLKEYYQATNYGF